LVRVLEADGWSLLPVEGGGLHSSSSNMKHEQAELYDCFLLHDGFLLNLGYEHAEWITHHSALINQEAN
jgi:hypothetical protein